MALGMEDGEWLMITDFLGTDGHGFYKKRHGGAARWEWLILHKAILKYRHGSLTMGDRPQIVLFYLTRPLLLGEVPPPS